MKNPSVRSRSGRVWRKRESRAEASSGWTAPRSSATHARARASSAAIRSSFSRARDRAGRVDERPAGAQRRGRPREDRLLDRGEALDQLGRLAPAGVGPRGERAEIGAGRIHENAIVAASEVGARGVCLRRTRTRVAPSRPPSSRELARPRGVELDRDDLALVSHPRRDRGGLDPRGRAEVEHPLARLRVEQRHDRLGGARLRRPARPRRSADARAPPSAAPTTSDSGGRQRRAPAALDFGSRRRGARSRSGSGSALSVLTRSAVSAGSFIAAISARASSGPSSSHHISASQAG